MNDDDTVQLHYNVVQYTVESDIMQGCLAPYYLDRRYKTLPYHGFFTIHEKFEQSFNTSYFS